MNNMCINMILNWKNCLLDHGTSNTKDIGSISRQSKNS